jgi:hypothetical protein
VVAYVYQNVWRVIARLEILRLDAFPTAQLIHTLDAYVLPKRAAMIVIDAHGQGQGVLSALHGNQTWSEALYVDRAIDAGFAGTTVLPGILMHRKCRTIVQNTGSRDGAWRCDKCGDTIYDMSQLQETTLQTKIWLTNLLKEAFANGDRVLRLGAAWPEGKALILGPDEAIVTELRNTTEIQRATTVAYISGSGAEHCTDALRCLMQAIQRYADAKKQGAFASVEEFGWAGEGTGGWTAPWERE